MTEHKKLFIHAAAVLLCSATAFAQNSTVRIGVAQAGSAFPDASAADMARVSEGDFHTAVVSAKTK